MTETDSREDVVSLLLGQHERIRRLFDEVAKAGSAELKREKFAELRRLLAVHETAEEMVTHPRARMTDGNAVVDELLEEEHDAKQMLADLEDMDVDSPGFDDVLVGLRIAVLKHAEHEERAEFPLLRQENDPATLAVMAKAVLAAEAIAPTHPHPAAGESLTTNAALGPIASVVDRTRDAVRAVIG